MRRAGECAALAWDWPLAFALERAQSHVCEKPGWLRAARHLQSTPATPAHPWQLSTHQLRKQKCDWSLNPHTRFHPKTDSLGWLYYSGYLNCGPCHANSFMGDWHGLKEDKAQAEDAERRAAHYAWSENSTTGSIRKCLLGAAKRGGGLMYAYLSREPCQVSTHLR